MILKILPYTPKKYIDTEVENIARAISAGFVILPVFLTFVLVRRLLQADYNVALIFGFGILATVGIWKVFQLGYLKESVFSIAIFFTILLTIVCTLGNGIHDTGLVGFPIIIGFSSIILDQKQLIITSASSVLGLAWLVMGERYGLFTPMPISVGGAGDFMVTAMLLGIGGFVAFSLTRNMKESLDRANEEIKTSKNEAFQLATQIDQKEEIIEEIHRAVINSLGHIKKLMDHHPNRKEELAPFYESIKRKVIVIESAHEILLSRRAPILLEINELTRQILVKYRKKIKAPVLHTDIDQISKTISLDQAIHFGILLIELVHEMDRETINTLTIRLKNNDELISLTMTGFSHEINIDNLVIELLGKQLKGTFSIEESELTFSFKRSIKK